MKSLTYFGNAYWTLLKFPPLRLADVFQRPSLIGYRGNAPNLPLTGIFWLIFEDQRLLPVTWFLKRVTGRVFIINKQFLYSLHSPFSNLHSPLSSLPSPLSSASSLSPPIFLLLSFFLFTLLNTSSSFFYPTPIFPLSSSSPHPCLLLHYEQIKGEKKKKRDKYKKRSKKRRRIRKGGRRKVGGGERGGEG
jgi:hypothetical protein